MKRVKERINSMFEAGTVEITVPSIPRKWALVPGDEVPTGILGEALQRVIDEGNVDKSVPTPLGMGYIVDATEYLNSLDTFCISADGNDMKVLMSTSDGLKVFSLDEFGEYISQEANIQGMGFPSKDYKIGIEFILPKDDIDTDSETPLEMVLKELVKSKDTTLADEAKDIIWGSKIPFVVWGKDDEILEVSRDFGDFISSYDEVLEVLQAQLDADPMSDAIIGVFAEVAELVAAGNLQELLSFAPELIEGMEEIVSDPTAAMAVAELKKFF